MGGHNSLHTHIRTYVHDTYALKCVTCWILYSESCLQADSESKGR